MGHAREERLYTKGHGRRGEIVDSGVGWNERHDDLHLLSPESEESSRNSASLSDHDREEHEEILDDKNMHRRFRMSNFQSTTRVRPFSTSMPIGLSGGWNQIQFNLADFTRRAYGTNYIETTRLQIHANCRIRRIYFADRLYSEDELPEDFKLFLPIHRKKCVRKEDVAKSKDKEEPEVEPAEPPPFDAGDAQQEEEDEEALIDEEVVEDDVAPPEKEIEKVEARKDDKEEEEEEEEDEVGLPEVTDYEAEDEDAGEDEIEARADTLIMTSEQATEEETDAEHTMAEDDDDEEYEAQ
ncbi:uncharacterized protein LOC143151569 isoform X2 [Ptiloglossa arizonensis]|uniref:uncharacterized protein LOC143151569 isoform X2 n=1 Tax=Ptiloglossa arizonensis TaxID=3350558 RepID=UPI003FA0D1FA